MSVQTQRTPDRARRWLVATVLLVAFLGAYWMALQRVGAYIGDGVEQALRPVPGLDEQAGPAPGPYEQATATTAAAD